MSRSVLYIVLMLAVTPNLLTAQRPAPAKNAFLQLQSLAGEWEGKDDSGQVVKSKFQLVAGNTAVMETLTMSGMEEMVTLYTVDGDGIALVHYCPTGNQPRMRAVPTPSEIRELSFAFQGATNLLDPAIGHEQKLLIEFRDKDHIIEHWTWRKNGKDTEMVYNLARKPA